MDECGLIDDKRPPALCDGLGDVNGVPAERPFEWCQLGKALIAVRTALRFDENALCPVVMPPPRLLVNANATRNAKHPVDDEPARNGFEVVGREGDVGVDLEPDVGPARQSLGADFEQGPNASAARAHLRRVLEQLDERHFSADDASGPAGWLVVTVDNDDPDSRSNGLCGQS